MNLNNLPNEVLFNILLNAEPKDIANYCQTSYKASGICKSRDFWRMKLWKDYGEQKQVEGMTWKQQYQSGPIRVINSPIAAGNGHYGIIDDLGDLYMGGKNNHGQLGDGTEEKSVTKSVTKVNLKSKVISVTTGLFHEDSSPSTGAVTEDGEVYIWGTFNSILVPEKLVFPELGKIVKFVMDNTGSRYGIITGNGSAYITGYNQNPPVLVQQNSKRKIVDLILPIYPTRDMWNMCFFLDNHGDVFLFYIFGDDQKITIKLDFPEPIRQLSASSTINVALSIKGDVYTWGKASYEANYQLRGTDDQPIFKFQVDISLSDSIPNEIYKANLPTFIESISTGFGNVAAVTNNGTVYVWGSNRRHRLIGPTDLRKLASSGKIVFPHEERYGIIILPLEIKLKSKIKSISLGNKFTIALTEDGLINYWGNEY